MKRLTRHQKEVIDWLFVLYLRSDPAEQMDAVTQFIESHVCLNLPTDQDAKEALERLSKAAAKNKKKKQ